MFSKLLKSQWTTYLAEELRGSSGCASVVIRILECERNADKGSLRFKGDYGVFLHEWLSKKWKEEGYSPMRMLVGSPWKWIVEIKGFPPATLQLIYANTASETEMYSDTLDAIIDALSTKA